MKPIIEILSVKGKGKGKPANNSDLNDASQELIDAVQSGDVKGVASALRDAFEACQEGYEDEPDEMEGDEE